MNEQIKEQRLELIRSYARKIWEEVNAKKSKWNPYPTDDELRSPIIECDLPFYSSVTPFVDRDILYDGINVVIWGSGSFSTGRMELEEWKRAKGEIKDFPVRYIAVISNNEKSNARKVAEEFNLPLVQIDFKDWYRDNYEDSKNPIGETGLFFPPGSELPDDIEYRFKVRKEFEEALMDLLEEKASNYADDRIFHSLRGYNFPIINSIDGWFYDDTHPADLSLLGEKGNPLYPGWQSGATEKMIEDGHKIFRSSLIWVHPIGEVENLQKVDAGELLALSEGIRYDGKDAKELQNIMKITEDSMLVALKAWGLFPTFWGFTHIVPVAYRQLNDEVVWREESNIIVGKRERSGVRAFGQELQLHLENLLSDIKKE